MHFLLKPVTISTFRKLLIIMLSNGIALIQIHHEDSRIYRKIHPSLRSVVKFIIQFWDYYPGMIMMTLCHYIVQASAEVFKLLRRPLICLNLLSEQQHTRALVFALVFWTFQLTTNLTNYNKFVLITLSASSALSRFLKAALKLQL